MSSAGWNGTTLQIERKVKMTPVDIEELERRLATMCRWDIMAASTNRKSVPRQDKSYYLQQFLSECRSSGKLIKDEDCRKRLQSLASRTKDQICKFNSHRYVDYIIDPYDPEADSQQ